MTKFKNLFLGLAVAYAFAALPLAHAQDMPEPPQGSGHKGHPGQRIEEVFNQLNLTDAQKKELEANKQQHRAVMQTIHKQMKIDREALQAELMKPQLDLPKIKEIHNRIKGLQAQMDDNRLGSILSVRTILTPEQFSKFDGIMRSHMKEHEMQHE